MRLGNRRVCVCVANTAVLATGGPATSAMCMCMYVCADVLGHWARMSESPSVECSSTAPIPPPRIHTPSTSSSSPGVSQLPCTYTPPSQTRELLFISLPTYPLLEWVTRMTSKSVCLYSSCLILPSPLVQFVCLYRFKVFKVLNYRQQIEVIKMSIKCHQTKFAFPNTA